MIGRSIFFVKNSAYNDYKITELDKSHEGILALSFANKISGYSFVIINSYLPPESTPWRRDAAGFMSYLLSQIYTISEFDAVFVIGDVNSRIGSKQDFMQNIDNISPRVVKDNTSNKHGEEFIDFLLESKMCILNCRMCPENDNVTCVKTLGRSVVDYICTFHDNLGNCKFFKVHLTRQLLDYLNVFERVIPDHSILELVFIPHFIVPNTNDQSNDVDQSTNNNSSQNIQQQNNVNDECTFQYFKRYKVRNMPVNFLNSYIAHETILQCIDNI